MDYTPAARDAALAAAAAALQQLLDERDIIAVVTRYCRALDTKDWEELRGVFLADATADLWGSTGGTLTGVDAIIDRVRRALEPLDITQHLVGNHEVVFGGNTATHRCYLQAMHVREMPEGSPNLMFAGRYVDQFERTEVGWRISHRTLHAMWTEGNLAVFDD